MDGYLVASFACLLVIMLNTEGSLALCSVNPSVKGIQVLKQRKAEARVNRITSLLSSEEELSSANRKELNSLLRCDTYDPTVFSESHRLFKLNQNKVFSTLGVPFLLILSPYAHQSCCNYSGSQLSSAVECFSDQR